MEKRIIYKEDGGVKVIIPGKNCPLTIEQIAAKDVPNGLDYEIVDVDKVPSDRTFRGAWKFDGTKVHADLVKAKELTHDRRRMAREIEFSPHDKEININIGNSQKTAEIEVARQSIRDKYAQKQNEIDNATTEQELKAIYDGFEI